MGKSSLMNRTRTLLEERGVRVAAVDMSMLSEPPPATADDWYISVLQKVARDLKLSVDMRGWWQARQEASPNQRLFQFFLEEVARLEAPVVVFVDEIDSTLKLPYSDGFFVALRSMYNERARDAAFKRFTFCLLGVATPNELIKDLRTTPYNIGRMVELRDFDPERDDLTKLYRVMSEDAPTGERLVKEVLRWTGGHPYLTLYVCGELVRRRLTAPDEVERAMTEWFSSLDTLRANPHFEQVLRFMEQRVDDKLSTLDLYRRIWKGRKVADRTTPMHIQLKLAGLVNRDGRGQLVVRNRIYRQLFTASWAQAAMPLESRVMLSARRLAVAAMLVLLLSPAIWFGVLYPRTLVQRLDQTVDDYAPAWSTYQELRDIPFRENEADEAWVRFLERRALRAERSEERDAALLWRLKALLIRGTDSRRSSVSALMGEDYLLLRSTARDARRAASDGPTGFITVAFSPDGQRVLIGSLDKTARVWSVETGQPVGPPLRHEDSVLAVAFSPDGQRVLTGSDDKTARVWSAETGQSVGPPLPHEDSVRAVAFSPDGQRVLTGSWDKTAQVWSAETGQPVGPPLRHEASVLAVAFSPDGQRVLTGSADKTARVWSAETGQSVGPPLPHEASVWAVAFSPDGQRVLTGSADKTARVWSAETGQPVGPPLPHEDYVLAVAFSPDGQRVLTGSWDRTARVWSAETGQPVGPPLRHEDYVWAVAFSPDGQRVLTGSDDNTARVWSAETGQSVGPPLRHEADVRAVAFSPDGQRVLTGSWDKTARVWSAETGQPVGPPLPHEASVLAVAFSPDGQRVLTGSDDNTARVWSAETGQSVGPPLPHEDYVLAVAFSPDGQRVLTGSWDKTARVWSAETGQPVGPPLRHESSVRVVAFSPDGQRVLTGSDDNTARVWSAETGQSVGPPLRHESSVRVVAFSPDGQRVLTGSWDNTARVWSAETGQPVGPPLRHEAYVRAVAFSPDGQRVLTGSDDKTARVWSAETGQPVGPPLRHEDSVRAVAFSPDGLQIVSATSRWIHVFRGDTHTRSDLLPGRLPDGQAIKFLDPTGSNLGIAARNTANTVQLVELREDQANVAPVEGDPVQLLAEWERRLGLRINEQGEAVPLHQP